MSLDAAVLHKTAETYIAALGSGDLEAILGLYTKSATVEDPVGGGKVLSNPEEIREFYASVTELDCSAELLEKRICGNELFFHFHLTTNFGDGSATVDVWDLMVHNDEGKIVSMKAYWGPENMSMS